MEPGMKFDETIIIGEKLNSTSTKIRKIFESRDTGALMSIASAQTDAGASWIDINAAMLMGGEMDTLLWAGRAVLEGSDRGISADSPDTAVLERCAAEFGKRCVVNSLTADGEILGRMLPVLARSGAGVIIMLKTTAGIPPRAEERLELAKEAASAAAANGMSPEMIFFDPVFQPVATGSEGLVTALETLRALAAELPGHHRIGGLSNVSFGLPLRKTVNSAFLAMAVSHGLDSVICDPTDTRLMELLKASEALAGTDPGCLRFLKHYRLSRKD
jgi:5-methyltetrahydrofolate corrinoid/iron sulfur protein methyltransferase